MTEIPSAAAQRPRLSLRLLAPEDLERVYAAALEQLAIQGVEPAGEEAREALLAAGATPVRAAGTVAAAGRGLALRSDVAEAAAARAPKRVVLGGRDAGADVVLEPSAALLGAGGRPAPQAEPLAGGPARDASMDDLETACRLADALPDVSVVVGPPLSAACARDDATRALEIGATVKATGKHVQLTGVTSARVAAGVASIAATLRDDEVDVRHRPPLSLLGGSESFAAAAAFARRGLPVGVLIARPAGPPVTELSPRDVTAALVRFVADALAANAAIQAIAPDVAFIVPVWPALAGLPATGPAAATFTVAATQVLTRAGLPSAVGAYATSAAEPDWLACTDGSFAALGSVLAGAAQVSGAGTLRGGAVFSPRQLVADAEIHSWCATIAAGIVVDDDTLAVEVIKRVGVGGNFLGQKHTRQHMKDVWRPRLLDRTPWDVWVADGRHGAADKAATLAGELLSTHEVEPLDAEVAATLERIIATAGL